MIAQRIFAILAAVMLVGAVALAVLGPPSVPLGQLLFMLDHDLMAGLQSATQTRVPTWAWQGMIVPVLARPAWLVPASVGLILAGMALSLSTRKSTHRSHRRS